MTSLPQPDDPENSFTLTYDAWHRLVRIEEGETTVAEYVYDGLNRRIVRIVGSTYEHFYHAAQNVVETGESDSLAAPEQPTYQYVWSLRYVDAPVLRDVYDGEGELQGDQRVYYLTDANFNVTALVACVDQTWQVVERYVYDAYGEVTIYNATWTGDPLTASAYANTILFTGQEYDPATGMYFYDGRWYDPRLGQFVGRDIIVTADANPYRYVWNNPVNFTDPSGHGPVGQPVWDASVGDYVDPVYEEWAEEMRERQRLAASQEGIGFLDWVQGGLDAGGVVEPTPFCDLASGVISVFRGNWADAGCSALAMIPYVGDTAKVAKYGRKAAKLAKTADEAAHAARLADKANDARKATCSSRDMPRARTPVAGGRSAKPFGS